MVVVTRLQHSKSPRVTLEKLNLWRKKLDLVELGTIPLAHRIFTRVMSRDPFKEWADARICQLYLATALWIAAKYSEAKQNAPTSIRMAEGCGVSRSSLIAFEPRMLDMLGWNILGH